MSQTTEWKEKLQEAINTGIEYAESAGNNIFVLSCTIPSHLLYGDKINRDSITFHNTHGVGRENNPTNSSWTTTEEYIKELTGKGLTYDFILCSIVDEAYRLAIFAKSDYTANQWIPISKSYLYDWICNPSDNEDFDKVSLTRALLFSDFAQRIKVMSDEDLLILSEIMEHSIQEGIAVQKAKTQNVIRK